MLTKSQIKISNKLVELMKTSSFEEITVAELCAYSGVSRGTFYNNFQRKEEVLELFCVAMFSEILDEFHFENGDWFQEIVNHSMKKIKENVEILQLLEKQDVFHIYSDALLKVSSTHKVILESPLYNCVPCEKRNYFTHAYVAVGVAVYKVWWKNGFVEQVDELVDIYLSVVKHPKG